MKQYLPHPDYPFLFKVPAKEYHKDPCDTPSISSSLAHTILTESPYLAYLKHPQLGGQSEDEGNQAMTDGTVIHSLLLGADERICILPYDDYRKKEARIAKAEVLSQGNVPVKQKDYDGLCNIATKIRAKMKGHGVPLDGAAEHMMTWENDTGGLSRCLMDHFEFRDGFLCIDDIKTTYDANPKRLQRHIYSMGYDIQAAAYVQGVERNSEEFAGRVKFTFWFCTLADPVMVVPVELSATYQALGKKRWTRACELFAHCMKEKYWPSFDETRVVIEPTKWQVNEEFDAAGPQDKPVEDYF